jgi:hypothetical protein
MVVFVCLGICYEICIAICPARKILKKIMVFQEVGLTKIQGDHETLSIVCHVGLHVDFSSMKSSLGL